MDYKLKPLINKQKGFTLTELIVVISILVLLTAIAFPIFIKQLNRTKVTVHNANIATLYSSARIAIAVNGNPDTGITWLNVDGITNPGFDSDRYISEWPTLPLGLYYSPGFIGGSTSTYIVRISTDGNIEISPAKISY